MNRMSLHPPKFGIFNSNTTLVAAQMHAVEKLKDIWDGSWNTCTVSARALSRAYARRIFELCRSNESRVSKSDTPRPCYWLVAIQAGNRCSGTVGRGTVLVYGCDGRVIASAPSEPIRYPRNGALTPEDVLASGNGLYYGYHTSILIVLNGIGPL